MTASWTFGHYPPGKFPLLAFPALPKGRLLSKESLIRDEQKEGSGVKGVNGWDRKRQTPARSPTRGAVVLSSRRRWDKLPDHWSSATFLFLLPLSLQKGGRKKEKKRRERWRRVGGGEERTKWKPDTQPCLVWMWAVGRMMSQIWSGIFSSPFDTFYHFSIFLCRALFLYFSRLEILFDKQFEEKQRTFSTVSARYIKMTHCGLSNKHPLIFHHEDGSSMMISYLWRLINTLHCLLVRSLKKFDTHRCSTEECGLAGVEKSACCQEKALT